MKEMLPTNWLSIELSKAIIYGKGKKPKTLSSIEKKGLIPYIDIKAFEKGIIDEYADIQSSRLIDEKDILVVWDGARFGLTGMGISGAAGSTLMVLKPVLCYPKYVFSFINRYYSYINSKPKGSGTPHVNPDIFWNLPFPIAPLNEQKRIVAKLDAIMPRIEAVKERLDKVPEILKRFRQSLLAAAVTGKLTEKWREEHPEIEDAELLIERIWREREERYKKNCDEAKKESKRKPKKPTNLDNKRKINNDAMEYSYNLPPQWKYVPLSFVTDNKLDSIVDGPFGSSINVKEDYIDIGVPVIRMVNIRPFKYISKNLKYIKKEKFYQLRRHNILPGDVLLAKVGATIGDCCIYPKNEPEGMLSTTGSCRISVENKIYSPFFLERVLNSYRQMLVSISSKTAQPFLNMIVIKALPVPLLSLEEQKEIIRQVDKLFALADKVETHYQKAKARVDKLSQSVLAKAFIGELVPQDPNDEPAEKLLERIMEEKVKMEAALKAVKKRIPQGKKRIKQSKSLD